MEQGNYTLYNRLKTIFTNDRIIIEEKMKPTFEVENISNLLLFSNHRYALNIEDGDRRLFTIWSNATAEDAKQKKADGYFIRLREWLGLLKLLSIRCRFGWRIVFMKAIPSLNLRLISRPVVWRR